jgi:hypothetical protein
LPCKWKQDSIVVFDEIVISNPYGPENISGENSTMLDRVKKVVSYPQDYCELKEYQFNFISVGRRKTKTQQMTVHQM